VHRVAADVPLLGVVCEQVQPDFSPRGEGNIRVGRETGAARETEHHRVRLPGTVFFVKPATTTSLTHHEPNRSLSFFCVVPLPCFLAYGRAFEPPGAGAPPPPP
jgi:hypothetical protein